MEVRPLRRVIRRVPLNAVAPSREQPRRRFQEDSIASLAESIERDGLLSPPMVRPCPGGYELIAGERRLLVGRKILLAQRQPAQARREQTLRKVGQRQSGLPAIGDGQQGRCGKRHHRATMPAPQMTRKTWRASASPTIIFLTLPPRPACLLRSLFPSRGKLSPSLCPMATSRPKLGQTQPRPVTRGRRPSHGKDDGD